MMIRPQWADGVGARAPAPAPHPRTTRLLTALLATLVAIAGLAILPATPAAASDHEIDQDTELLLDCVAITPIGPVGIDGIPMTLSTTYPPEIQRGQTGVIQVVQAPIEVPPELEVDENTSATINNAKDAIVRFKAPAGFQVVSVQSVGGQDGFGAPIASSASFSLSTGIITWTIPGPFVPAQSPITPPDLLVELRATGAAGHVGSLLFDSFSTTSNVTLEGVTLDLAVACGTPSSNPPLAAITITPGVYVPEYEPVSTQTNMSGQCQVRYPSVALLFPPGSNVNFPLNDVPFFVSGVPDVQPGEQTTVLIDVGAYDWVGQIQPGVILGQPVHVATAIQNWRVDIRPPAGFSVVGVSAGGGMTATLAAADRIRWAMPTGAAGEFGPGLWTPPAPLQVTLQATSGLGHVGEFQLFGSLSTAGTNNTGSTTGLEWVTRRLENLGGSTANATTRCSHTTARWNHVNHNRVLGTLGVETPPVAVDDEVTASNAFPTSLNVMANDEVGSAGTPLSHVEVVAEGAHGSVTTDPSNPGAVIYTPPLGGTQAPSDSFTYVVLDQVGRVSNVATVTVELSGAFCHSAPCELNQFIHFDVEGAALTLAQSESSIELQTITLHGQPQPTSGLLNPLTVTNRRGDGQNWSVTGQVTDFKEDPSAPDCPASDSSTWYFRCIPGDNLGWAPVAAVDHHQVPGDVATVSPGSNLGSGLGGTARTLCQTLPTTSGGTFECGATLTLITPASAAAQVYEATLTLTLA